MKHSKKIITFAIAIVISILLTACAVKPTSDPNQKMTEIAGTVQAQLTQEAALLPTATETPLPPTATLTLTPVPPTNTPSNLAPTNTPYIIVTQPTGTSSDDAKFIADVTIPDGTTLEAGEQFVKTWRFQNTGKTTWTKDYAIQYLEGNLQGRNGILTFNLAQDVPPGESVDVNVNFTAPTNPGTYSSYWKLLSASGYYFGDVVSININVGVPTSTVPPPTSTPKPTKTPTP
jgi:hypothetical protein